MNTTEREATVIGAGIAGLLASYRLLQAGYKIDLHEKSSSTGGLISTHMSEFGPIETAAHSIRSSPEILQLFSDLDLPYVTARTRKKFIYRQGKLRSNPFTFYEMFAAACYASFKKSDGRSLTLAEWTRSHMGEAAIGNAMSPLAHGIYAADPEELDQQLAFPRFTIPEGQTFIEKIFKAKEKSAKAFVMAPRDGMGALVTALTDRIGNHKNARIILNSDINSLPAAPNIILSTPANIAGKLIGSRDLETLTYAPMLTATVFIRKADLPKLDGIGVLMARDEDKLILGALFNSTTFDKRTTDERFHSLTVMLGGTRNYAVLDKTDDDIQALVMGELNRVLGLKSAPQGFYINRWPQAIPLYSSHLRETLEGLKSGWCQSPGRILFGNYTGDVSIRGMCGSSLALAGN